MEMTKEQEARFDQMCEDVRKLREVMVGNKDFKEPGLIADVKMLKGFMRQITNMKWYALGAIGVGAAIFGLIQLILSIFNIHIGNK